MKLNPKHCSTETDYAAAMLDVITLADWRAVVLTALEQAKNGDAAARSWLAGYLIGKPETKAVAPTVVAVQQITGHNPLVDRVVQRVAVQEGLFDGLSLTEPDLGRVRRKVAATLDRPRHESSGDGDDR